MLKIYVIDHIDNISIVLDSEFFIYIYIYGGSMFYKNTKKYPNGIENDFLRSTLIVVAALDN